MVKKARGRRGEVLGCSVVPNMEEDSGESLKCDPVRTTWHSSACGHRPEQQPTPPPTYIIIMAVAEDYPPEDKLSGGRLGMSAAETGSLSSGALGARLSGQEIVCG